MNDLKAPIIQQAIAWATASAEARVNSENLEMLDSSVTVPGTCSIISY